MTVRVFSLCRRENKDKIQGSKLKVHTFVFCCSAVRHYEPSSGRKVSRMSVTEGACETEKRKKAEVFRRFNVNPSGAPRQLPLHKGAMSRCDFWLCAAEKAKGEFKTSTPKTAKNRKSRTLLQSLRDSSLSEGAYDCACLFFVPQRKQGQKSGLQNQKQRKN